MVAIAVAPGLLIAMTPSDAGDLCRFAESQTARHHHDRVTGVTGVTEGRNGNE
jgi:hypothetical protein